MVLDVPAGSIARPIVTIDENAGVLEASMFIVLNNGGHRGQCGSRYHKGCSETVVNCIECSRTLVANVVYPEP